MTSANKALLNVLDKDAICDACYKEIKKSLDGFADKYDMVFDLSFWDTWEFEAIEDDDVFTCIYEDESCRVMVTFLTDNGYEFTYEFTEFMFEDEYLVEKEVGNGEYFRRSAELEDKFGELFDEVVDEINRIAGKYYTKFSA
ncbi:MAG TPA: hypothetical protein O0X39_07990 [Methanocorpusculum sp.]|nr:hypothetical protein [Methanocorpusculum sp.]